MGQFGSPLEGPEDSSYGKDGIRKVILEKVKSVPAKYNDPKKGLIVIIKLDKKTNYRNMVDILDEMAIAKRELHALVAQHQVVEEPHRQAIADVTGPGHE